MPSTAPSGVEPVPMRRTHAERSATTRAALLDATIDCLAELGYAGTTTAEVVKRAGLSRGAQVHHFPTKALLISAALDRLLRIQRQGFVDRFAALPAASRTEPEALGVLWTVLDSQAYRALLQLAVASFADHDLRESVAGAFLQLERTVLDTFAETFPDAAERANADVMALFAFRALGSAALYRELGLSRQADEMVAMLRMLSQVKSNALAQASDS
jgi:AcrR family transcriptional regulator